MWVSRGTARTQGAGEQKASPAPVVFLPSSKFPDFLNELQIVRERNGNQDADDQQHH